MIRGQKCLLLSLRTYSFLWQHFHFFIELLLAVKSKKSFKEKISIILGRPEKLDSGLRKTAETFFQINQSTEPILQPLHKYVIWQIIILLVSLTSFILLEEYLTIAVKIAFAAVTVLTLINCGAIMEQKRWVFYIEYIRLLIIFALPFNSLDYWQIKGLIVLILLLPLLGWYQSIQKRYLYYVYR